MRMILAAAAAFALAPAAGAVSFTVLGQTGGTLGFNPRSGVVMDTAGNLWGTSANGGANSVGALWRLNAGGGFDLIHSFARATGTTPLGQLTFGPGGEIFGVTSGGGANNRGSIWSVDTATGAFTSRASFDLSTTGLAPQSGMVHDGAGNFYGTTFGGVGASDSRGGVYSYSVAGGLTQIAAFTSAGTGPKNPIGTLALVDGRLVGTSSLGATGNPGTVFSLNPDGTGLTVDSILPTSSSARNQGVTAGADGALYGLLNGQLYRVDAGGPTVLATFAGNTSSASEMILDAAGNFFGTMRSGGQFDQGYAFRWTPGDSALTVLHSFQGLANQFPEGRLFADGLGNLYGASTGFLGIQAGTVWRLSDAGFVPFDEGGPGSGVIPEPATWAMLVAGFGLVGAGLRRRRRQEAVAV